MMKRFIFLIISVFLFTYTTANAQELSCYMGGEVVLETAPNGAIVNAEVLKTIPQIVYTGKNKEVMS